MPEASTVALIQQLYIAYYGRPADPGGRAYWTEYFSSTDNLDLALAAFGTSAEFTDRYGGLSTTALVNGLYGQLFNREADAGGLAFYSEQLDSGAASLASIALDIANGAQNADRTILDNKITVATGYTAAVETNDLPYGAIAAAQALLAAVDATLDSVAADIERPVVLLSDPDLVDERQVNTSTAGLIGDISVTGLSDGGWVVTWWHDVRDTGDIYGQVYHANGAPQGAEFRIDTFQTFQRYPTAPSVSGLSDGGWVVTWQGFDQDNSYGISGQAYHANGAPQGAEFRVNTFQGYPSVPSVTGLSDGGWVITWYYSVPNNVSVDYDIYGQAYHADGARQGGKFRVNTFTIGEQSFPSVTGLRDGGWVVIWDSFEQDGPGVSVYAQIYHANGAPQGGEFRVHPETRDDHLLRSVTSLSDGGWAVISIGLGSGFDTYGQVYHANGTPQNAELRVEGFASVAGLSDGGWVIALSDYRYEQDGLNVYGQVYHANGSPQGAEFQVSTLQGYHQSPLVTALSDGGWVVTWQRGEVGQDSSIHSKAYNADGTVRSYAELVTYTENGDAVAVYPELALSDLDSNDLVSAIISLSDFRVGDRLTVDRGYSLPAGIDATYHNDTGAVTLEGAASLADYEAALEHIVYSSFADLSGTASRTIELVVYDGEDSNGGAPGGVITTDHASDPVFTTITVAGDELFQ